ncbi:MAG: adenylosuccinate lyase [Deltaproteobacteria bacterium]|nr:adenylosuccinate lyase [Deltaproteobacteria bacterium]
MIERYSRKELSSLWSLEHKYEVWLQVELAHLEVLAEEGWVASKVVQTIRKKAKIDVQKISQTEKKVKHDVIAFLTVIAESVGEELPWLHYGLTSSDVVDSAFAILLRESLDKIINEIHGFLKILKDKSDEYKKVICVGRTHGIHAEPTSFGLKFVLWHAAMARSLERLKGAKEHIAFGKFSGAVGNFAHLSPSQEEKICKKLGLKPEPISTQIIPRDRHAEVFSVLAILASTLEQIALEIRHLQRTEVSEVEEPFEAGQKGSSAMPHKKNPIGCENITGLARLVRSYAEAAFQNIALWHERDISHSSVERVIAPDATVLVDFMLHRLGEILKKLVIHPDKMMENVNKTQGLIYSQQVLLTLTQKGVDRKKAYGWVQVNALSAWQHQQNFLEVLSKDENILTVLSMKELKECFEPKNYLKHIDTIYKRVFHED